MTFVYGFLGGVAGGSAVVLGSVLTARRAMQKMTASFKLPPLAAKAKP